MSDEAVEKIRERLEEMSTSLTRDLGAFRNFWTFDEYWDSFRIEYETQARAEDSALVSFGDAYMSGFRTFKEGITERYAVKRAPFFSLLEYLESVSGSALHQPSAALGQEAAQHLNDFLVTARAEMARCDQRKEKVTLNGDVAWVAAGRSDESFILASGYPQQVFVDLDLYLGFPDDLAWLVNRYAEEVQELFLQEGGVDCLCFVEKRYGVSGPIELQNELMAALPDLSVAVLPEAGEPRLARGAPPGAQSNVCIIYDLVCTGAGIREAAGRLQSTYGPLRTSSVVLFKYGPPDVEPVVGISVVSILQDDRPLDVEDLRNALEEQAYLSPRSEEERRDRSWLVANWQRIEQQYPDRWVAVVDERVVASGSSISETVDNGKRAVPSISSDRFQLACMTDPKLSLMARS